MARSNGNRRRRPRRTRETRARLELISVKNDLEVCVERVGRLERTVERLRTELDRLHEKIRS